MRKINNIVIHHSAVYQPDINKLISSMNRTHKDRIWQPADKNWSHVAYHYTIWVDWKIVNTRDLWSIWWHTNSKVNWSSIGICLSGNFDVNVPTNSQYNSLNEVIADLSILYPWIKVSYHNDYSKKTCPWLKFQKNRVLNLNNNIMSIFKNVWENEVKESDRIFTDYKADSRPISIQDAKYLIDIAIARDNIKDRSFVQRVFTWLLNILKR